jgi:hypothetical protein
MFHLPYNNRNQKYINGQKMHFKVYDIFYLQYSQQHVSAGISTIYRVILLLFIIQYRHICFGDRIPVGARFSARPDRPWGPPTLLYNGYRVFPGGKVRPGRDADPSPPSSAEVLEE